MRIRIYDVLGRSVVTLIDGPQKAGYYTLLWDGKARSGVPASSGVYFYRIEAGSFVKARKMTLVK